MKSILLHFMRALGVCALMAIMAFDLAAQQRPQQGEAPQMSEAEREAMTKINTAVDAAAKLLAADEFVKKFPKSARRGEVARHVAAEIVKIQDTTQVIGLLENFRTVFKEPSEADIVTINLLDAYVKAERFDDAFNLAAPHIQKNPSDVATLTQMALVGTDLVRRQNPKFVQQSQTYGLKAIELIEANSRPESIDILLWSDYQTRWLPQLYQSMGLLSYVSQNKADARAKLEKAASLNSSDPFNYLLLGSLVNDEYQQLAQQHKGMADGAAKDELLKKAQAKMDEVIDLYAHVIALSEGKAQYQQLHDQLMNDFETYYKYRHNGTTEGMRELIDKYKTP